MSIHNAIRGIGVAACVAIGMLLFTASGAFAASTKSLEERIAALEATLKGVQRSGNTLEFSGMNVRVDNGTGSEETVNGLGNLSVGYDELLVTGSNSLIVGKTGRASSWGDLVSGELNKADAPNATVSGVDNHVTAEGRNGSIAGGEGNTVSAYAAAVSGGQASTASGMEASVSGGELNQASGEEASVSGGEQNTASNRSSVSGGRKNNASGAEASVSGGEENTASGSWSSVSGGDKNTALPNYSSILGGKLHETKLLFECIPSCP